MQTTLVFPADAGMNRIHQVMIRHGNGVPRGRGDEPHGRYRLSVAKLCSPRTRG